MARKADKTNALRLLEQRKLPCTPVDYSDTGAVSGPEVAAALGQAPETVFKTLVTTGRSGAHYVFVIPVCRELDLKKAARCVGEKSVSMLPQRELLPLTGYVHGGCSPLGMKTLFPTVVDRSAQALPTFCISGGRIGLQLRLSPETLRALIPFTYEALCTEEDAP